MDTGIGSGYSKSAQIPPGDTACFKKLSYLCRVVLGFMKVEPVLRTKQLVAANERLSKLGGFFLFKAWRYPSIITSGCYDFLLFLPNRNFSFGRICCNFRNSLNASAPCRYITL
jgi:hypothetical protein